MQWVKGKEPIRGQRREGTGSGMKNRSINRMALGLRPADNDGMTKGDANRKEAGWGITVISCACW